LVNTGRMIELAGSEGMPLSCPTKGIALVN
jgi:hypothetical protein